MFKNSVLVFLNFIAGLIVGFGGYFCGFFCVPLLLLTFSLALNGKTLGKNIANGSIVAISYIIGQISGFITLLIVRNRFVDNNFYIITEQTPIKQSIIEFAGFTIFYAVVYIIVVCIIAILQSETTAASTAE